MSSTRSPPQNGFNPYRHLRAPVDGALQEASISSTSRKAATLVAPSLLRF